MYIINNKEYKCSVAVTLDIFNDRWKLAVIWYLLEKDKRFKELSEDINEIKSKDTHLKIKRIRRKKHYKKRSVCRSTAKSCLFFNPHWIKIEICS